MRRLFLDPSQFAHTPVEITGAGHHHLVNVLRVRPGEALVLLDGQGRAWRAEVRECDRRSLTVDLRGEAEVAPEPAVHIVVAQALGKGDRFEEALTHATEAGASAFVPLITERTVVRLQSGDIPAKLARWRTVVQSAAEQSGRARIPGVEPPAGIAEVARRPGTRLLLLPAGMPLIDVASGLPRTAWAEPITVVVGPEGGISREEEEACRAGCVAISLGPHILRTETAAVVAVAQLLLAHAWVARRDGGPPAGALEGRGM